MAWREAQASTVTVFPGFLHVGFICPACGAKWEGIAAIGVEGVQCPKCGAHDESFVWLPDADDPQRATMPHDGCWLTGEFPLQMEVRPFRAEDINAAFDKDVKPLFPLTWRQRIMVRLLNWLIGKLVEVR